jgi:hypothetical protein
MDADAEADVHSLEHSITDRIVEFDLGFDAGMRARRSHPRRSSQSPEALPRVARLLEGGAAPYCQKVLVRCPLKANAEDATCSFDAITSIEVAARQVIVYDWQ